MKTILLKATVPDMIPEDYDIVKHLKGATILTDFEIIEPPSDKEIYDNFAVNESNLDVAIHWQISEAAAKWTLKRMGL